MTLFHKWLIRQRRFCEHSGCLMRLTEATIVINCNGKDYVYCDFHGYQPKQQPTLEKQSK